MYFSKIRQNVIAAGCIFSLLCGAAPAFAHEATQEDEAFYISFQVQGSRTFPQAINEFVSVTGSYIDASGRQHGFVRDVWGKIETFDPPDSTLTAPTSINGEGTIAGYYADAQQVQHGFVRYTTGKIKTFDPPESVQTFAQSINASGTITGYYQQSPLAPNIHSFVRNADGAFTTFNPPGCPTSFALSINREGGITGFALCTSDPVPTPFLRDSGGTATVFPTDVGGWALSINNDGFAAGYLRGTGQAFLLSPQGTFTVFDIRGNSFTTTPIGINDEKAIAGTCITGPGCGSGTGIGNHGFVISPQGKVTAFDPPVRGSEQVFTVATSINNLGVITGSYVFGSSPGGLSSEYGFLRVPLPRRFEH